MIAFEKNFSANGGKPFCVDNTEYRMVVRVNSGNHGGIRVSFGQCINSPKQGIRFDCEAGLTCRGRSSQAFVFWRNTSPNEIDIACPHNADITIRNVWDNGDGVEQSWHAGGAMVVEQDERTIRIRANSTLENDHCEDFHCELTWLDEPRPFQEKRGFFARLFRR